MVEKMKWKVECQAKVRNSMSCATQCPTTLPIFLNLIVIRLPVTTRATSVVEGRKEGISQHK